MSDISAHVSSTKDGISLKAVTMALTLNLLGPAQCPAHRLTLYPALPANSDLQRFQQIDEFSQGLLAFLNPLLQRLLYNP